jgi:hypothetical protein
MTSVVCAILYIVRTQANARRRLRTPKITEKEAQSLKILFISQLLHCQFLLIQMKSEGRAEKAVCINKYNLSGIASKSKSTSGGDVKTV